MGAYTLVTNTTVLSVGNNKNVVDLFLPDYDYQMYGDRQTTNISKMAPHNNSPI